MGVPIVYRKGQGQVLANYDYVDIATGTGYIKFYAGGTYANGISGSHLSNLTFYSNPANLSVGMAGGSASFQKHIDLDFDTLINKPMIFKGKAIINVPFVISHSGTGTGFGYVHAKLRKWDGSAETEIANASGQTISQGAGTTSYNTLAFNFDVPQTNYKKGETLRLTIEGWSYRDSGTTFLNIFFDPMNRDTSGGSIPTTLIGQLPVRITL